jgi:hypothetical protein
MLLEHDEKTYVYQCRAIQRPLRRPPAAVKMLAGTWLPSACISEVNPDQQVIFLLNRLFRLNPEEYRKGQQYLDALTPVQTPDALLPIQHQQIVGVAEVCTE